MPTLRENLALAATELERAGSGSARLTAEVLLARLLGRDRAYLYAHPEQELPSALEGRWREWIARRAAGVPLQHLTGEQEFFGRTFLVTSETLIPRPETELLVEAALERMPAGMALDVAEIGAGSGCVAITLALERPRAQILATDISAAALAVARENARRLGAAVQFAEGDLLAGLAGAFDLVVSNPPYLSDAELTEAPTEVREHEPAGALAAGPTGLEVYARLIPEAWRRLRPGGWLLLELGYASAPGVRALLAPDAWGEVATRRDLQQWERVLEARRA